jgi:hypothetical protein
MCSPPRLLAVNVASAPPAPKTLGQVAQEYFEFKRGKGKRSIRQDEGLLAKLKARFGEETPLAKITAQRIAQYDRQRGTETSKSGRAVTPSAVNRELAVLRHLLRLAGEWGYIEKVPKVRLAKEPEGRLRFIAGSSRPARPASGRARRCCRPSSWRSIPACARTSPSV